MYRKKEKPYHIDYCFASDSIASNGFKLSIEHINKWIEISDHVPMIVDLISLNESSTNDFSLAHFVKGISNNSFASKFS